MSEKLREILLPGLWVDEGGDLHVSIPQLLTVFGWPDDAEHRAAAQRIAVAAIREHYPAIVVTERE